MILKELVVALFIPRELTIIWDRPSYKIFKVKLAMPEEVTNEDNFWIFPEVFNSNEIL